MPALAKLLKPAPLVDKADPAATKKRKSKSGVDGRDEDTAPTKTGQDGDPQTGEGAKNALIANIASMAKGGTTTTGKPPDQKAKGLQDDEAIEPDDDGGAK